MNFMIRRLLFALEAERSHRLGLEALSAAARLRLVRPPSDPGENRAVEVLGLQFPNAVGLAAGLDKNADHIRALAAIGFGFIEVGTVTPRAQAGNPRPRLFRLPDHQAVINRMGFNNKGVDHLVARVCAARRRTMPVLGINIGKNRDTPLGRALDDYRYCLERVYPEADYVVVNVSSPNTPGLRDLQTGDHLGDLLSGLKSEQHRLHRKHRRYVPLVVKIAPDVNSSEIHAMASVFQANDIDGVAATNTTISRTGVDAPMASETGGLSGAPLFEPSTEVLRELRTALGPRMPLIGIGGILTGGDAAAKIHAGADLVQLYTGLVYRGPALVPEVVRAVEARGQRPSGR